MNVKIKSSGVFCLIGEDYDRVYATLKRQFGDGKEQLFTERTPGHEYLQWELPGEGWIKLSEADPIMGQEVRRLWLDRQKSVSSRFGANQTMASRILTVPDESYVYYRPAPDGEIIIRQVAWGYRYPERIGGSAIDINVTPATKKELTSVTFLSGGKPVPGKEFKINGFNRLTDESGRLIIGDLEVGYEFDIEVDGTTHHCRVEQGEGSIEIDTTRMARISVSAKIDGVPYAGQHVTIGGNGAATLELVTDASGNASGEMVYDPAGVFLTARLGNESSRQLMTEDTHFEFNIVTILADPGPETEKEDEKDGEQEEKQEPDEEKVAVPPTPPVPPVTDPEKETEPVKEEEDTKDEPEDIVKPPVPPLPAAQPTSWKTYAGAALLGLALALLTWFTYSMGNGVLFH